MTAPTEIKGTWYSIGGPHMDVGYDKPEGYRADRLLGAIEVRNQGFSDRRIAQLRLVARPGSFGKGPKYSVELRGPNGRSVELPPGVHAVGRLGAAADAIDNPAASNTHLFMKVGEYGTVEICGAGRNGTNFFPANEIDVAQPEMPDPQLAMLLEERAWYAVSAGEVRHTGLALGSNSFSLERGPDDSLLLTDDSGNVSARQLGAGRHRIGGRSSELLVDWDPARGVGFACTSGRVRLSNANRVLGTVFPVDPYSQEAEMNRVLVASRTRGGVAVGSANTGLVVGVATASRAEVKQGVKTRSVTEDRGDGVESKGNEDRFLVMKTRFGTLVVAIDGLGGHSWGVDAATAARQAIADYAERSRATTVDEFLQGARDTAAKRLDEKFGRSDADCAIGLAVIGDVNQDNKMSVAALGLGDVIFAAVTPSGVVHQLTRDDSFKDTWIQQNGRVVRRPGDGSSLNTRLRKPVSTRSVIDSGYEASDDPRPIEAGISRPEPGVVWHEEFPLGTTFVAYSDGFGGDSVDQEPGGGLHQTLNGLKQFGQSGPRPRPGAAADYFVDEAALKTDDRIVVIIASGQDHSQFPSLEESIVPSGPEIAAWKVEVDKELVSVGR